MKIIPFVKFNFLIPVCMLFLSGCMSGSISIKGDDCKMNGSFEIIKDGLPVNWNYYSPKTVPNSDFSIICDNTLFKEGKQSLKFQINKCESMGGWHSPGFFEEFKVRPGETYKVSFWVINKGSYMEAKAETGMEGNPGISESIVNIGKTFSEWQYYEHDIQIPKNNDNLRFEANILSPGTIWFDDIRITGVNDSSEMTLYPYRGYEECK